MLKTYLAVKRFAAYSLLCCAVLLVAEEGVAAQGQTMPGPAPRAVQSTSTLTIRIMRIRNAKGKINIALFPNANGFPSAGSSGVISKQVEIDSQSRSATAVFQNLPQGVYAAALLHDEDMSGAMEFDAQGIPLKGYGFSNNPDASMGPPTPESAKFTVNQPESAIEIKMFY